MKRIVIEIVPMNARFLEVSHNSSRPIAALWGKPQPSLVKFNGSDFVIDARMRNKHKEIQLTRFAANASTSEYSSLAANLGPCNTPARSILNPSMKNLFILSFLLVVAGCSQGPQGARIVTGGSSAVPARHAAPIRNLAEAEIRAAVIGKTFQYTRTASSGLVTYKPDGTLDVQDDEKGPSKGMWKVKGDQYCENYAPDFALECGVFKYTGNAYFAANSRIVEMKTW